MVLVKNVPKEKLKNKICYFSPPQDDFPEAMEEIGEDEPPPDGPHKVVSKKVKVRETLPLKLKSFLSSSTGKHRKSKSGYVSPLFFLPGGSQLQS